jgi:hypothetical protein
MQPVAPGISTTALQSVLPAGGESVPRRDPDTGVLGAPLWTTDPVIVGHRAGHMPTGTAGVTALLAG